MKKPLSFVVLAVVLGAGGAMSLAWAQTPTPAAPPTPPTSPVGPTDDGGPPPATSAPPAMPPNVFTAPEAQYFNPGGWARGYAPNGRRPHRPDRAQMAEMKALATAVEKLKAAKEGPEKEAATKELTQQLEKSFIYDLERREKEVAEIEGRVKKLRDQIEKRKKAKEEIISLRLKTIINETEGLGFPGPGFERPEPGPAGLGGVGGFGGMGSGAAWSIVPGTPVVPQHFDATEHHEPGE
jgi:hypothetical protein